MTTLPQPASALQAVFRVTQLPAWCRFGWPPIAAALVLAVLVLATAAAYLYIPHDPIAINPLMRLKPASADHWLGTDALGRDVFSRVMAGGQVSLLVGVAAAVISIAAGLCIGLVSGFFRVLDGVVMRITDAVMSVPSILLAIALVALNGPSIWSVIIAITVPEVPRVVRLVRSVVLSAREEPYVEAALALGTSMPGILWRHIMPNTLAPLMVQATYVCASAILTEAVLSFLGRASPPRYRPGATSWRKRACTSRSARG